MNKLYLLGIIGLIGFFFFVSILPPGPSEMRIPVAGTLWADPTGEVKELQIRSA